MSSFEALKSENISGIKIDVSYVGFRIDIKDVLGAKCIKELTQEEFEKLLEDYIGKLKPKANVHITR